MNGGRIAEIATRPRFGEVEAASGDELPPPGPYPKVREAVAVIAALAAAKKALATAEASIRAHSRAVGVNEKIAKWSKMIKDAKIQAQD